MRLDGCNEKKIIKYYPMFKQIGSLNEKLPKLTRQLAHVGKPVETKILFTNKLMLK